jgi:transposase
VPTPRSPRRGGTPSAAGRGVATFSHARRAGASAGHAALDDRPRPLAPAAVEATGGLELPAVAALAAAGIPVVTVAPRPARDFAEGTGRLAKTDRIDAQALADFAEAVRPDPRPLWQPRGREGRLRAGLEAVRPDPRPLWQPQLATAQ